jgi:hypothetical protein
MQPRCTVQLRPLHLPPSFVTTHKQFLISMGRIVRNSEALKHFLVLAFQEFSEPLVGYVLDKMEAYCAYYMVRWAECSFERMFTLLRQPFVATRLSAADFLFVMSNEADVRSEVSTPGQRYKGTDKRVAAATKIQATWRMHALHSAHLEMVCKLRAGEKFRQKWRIRHMLSRIRSSREQRHLEHLARYKTLREAFRADWRHIKNKKRVMIHLPSLSFDSSVRTKYDSPYHGEIRQFGRLLHLLDSNVYVVYITHFVTGEIEKCFKQTIGTYPAFPPAHNVCVCMCNGSCSG